jgi:formyltetrahydrofolate deformylase
MMNHTNNQTARLLVTCPDQPGIVAAITNFLYTHGVNIIDLDQHSSPKDDGSYFMRLEFQTENLDTSKTTLEANFQKIIATPFQMDWMIHYTQDIKQTVILVSTVDHVIMELLWLWKQGNLPTNITCVISNHDELRQSVESFGIPYHHVPVTPETKEKSEASIQELIGDDVNLIVLARYMQILSRSFIDSYPKKIINIHHSFLPAFIGSNPYKQAYERGVKLIGATSHYATEELDAGPIIDQDVARVTHRHSVNGLRELGRDLERRVLTRAVQWHLEDRIIVHGNKTIVFGV